MKAEQGKQPATPLLGRKVFPDTTDFSTRPSPLVHQTILDKSETKPDQKDTLSIPNGIQTDSHRTRAEKTEARVGYVRQEMKPERLQPKIDHVEAKVTEKLPPAQEGSKAEREGKAAQGMVSLTAEGKSSRHPERRRDRHDRRLERQESSEQEVPKPEQVEEKRRRDRHEKRLERQGSSEQETPKHDLPERRREKHERRLERQESSERETPRNEPERQAG